MAFRTRIRNLLPIALGYLALPALAAGVDPTFGNSGVVVTDFGAASSASALALQADGKIVVSGARGQDLLLTRYLPSGTIDSGFAGGYTTLSVPISGYLGPPRTLGGRVVVRPGGGIVVAGTSWYILGQLGANPAFVAGFTTHGARDSTWGNQGVSIPGPLGQYGRLDVLPEDKVLATGTLYVPDGYRSHRYWFSVDRYAANGNLDAGFAGGAGRIEASALHKDSALDPAGNIVSAGWTSATFTTTRFSSSGTQVSTSTTPVGTENLSHLGMAVQADGKILMAGSPDGNDGLLARFDPSGALDPTFGNAGIVRTSPPVADIVLQADGKILGRTSGWEVMRFNADGTPDASFGRNGRFALAMAQGGVSSALALQPDGKILLAGWTAEPMKVALGRIDPAAPSATVTVAPTSLAFGGQSAGTTSAPRVVTFTNTGITPVAVSEVATSSNFVNAHDCSTLAAGASCSVEVRFAAPGAPLTLSTSPVTGTLLIAVGGEGVYVALSGTMEPTLTAHYYRTILQREPDSAGRSFWNSEASRVRFTLGADPIETWFALAISFFSSAEYAALARDNAGFVADLYRTFYDRAPDAAGSDYWVGQLQSGLPREVALAAFMFSTEFTDFIKKNYGNVAIRPEVGMVFDFYRGVLGRLPDTNGFNYWIGRFRQAQCIGGDTVRVVADQISGEFARSTEYSTRGRTSSQYVGDLYNAFLRRGGDLAGVQFWIGQLDSGAQAREQLRGTFVTSPEFSARVSAVASQGCPQQ